MKTFLWSCHCVGNHSSERRRTGGPSLLFFTKTELLLSWIKASKFPAVWMLTPFKLICVFVFFFA